MYDKIATGKTQPLARYLALASFVADIVLMWWDAASSGNWCRRFEMTTHLEMLGIN